MIELRRCSIRPVRRRAQERVQALQKLDTRSVADIRKAYDAVGGSRRHPAGQVPLLKS